MSTTGSALSGSLADTGAADVLRHLADGRQSGLLKIGDTSPGWVALADGNLILAGSASGPTLADSIHVAAAVDEETVRAAVQRVGSHDLRLLEQLAPAHADALHRVVFTHSVGAVFQMLLPSTEGYVFQPGSRHPLGDQFAYDVSAVLEEAARRVGQWAEIAASIPSAQAVFRPRRTLNPSIVAVELSRDEWTVLAVLDGRRSVAQAIAASGRSSFDVCSVIHRLLGSGLLERAS